MLMRVIVMSSRHQLSELEARDRSDGGRDLMTRRTPTVRLCEISRVQYCRLKDLTRLNERKGPGKERRDRRMELPCWVCRRTRGFFFLGESRRFPSFGRREENYLARAVGHANYGAAARVGGVKHRDIVLDCTYSMRIDPVGDVGGMD